MRRVSVRVDDTLYQRLQRRALGTNLSLSDFVRSVLVQAADTRGRYIYSSQDELLGIVIQILTLLATSIGEQSPNRALWLACWQVAGMVSPISMSWCSTKQGSWVTGRRSV